MKQTLMKAFALSDKGAADLCRAILSVTAANLALMLPVGLLYRFTGECIGQTLGGHAVLYLAGTFCCLALIWLTAYFQYNATFFATYIESGKRRIALAEKLRRLPLSFFGKRDLADLSSTIMADCEALEHAGSHQIPQYYGSILSTALVCVGLFCMNRKMALAAVWPIPLALLIVLSFGRVQSAFSVRHTAAKIRLNEGVQEFIEASRDLKSYNAEQAYLAELSRQIDAVESRAIQSELGIALFVVSAQLLLKFGIGTTAVAGSAMLLKGELSLMQFFCFLLAASRLYEPMSGTLINLGAIHALQANVERMNTIQDYPEQTGVKEFRPAGYDIRFDHAGFSYEDGKTVLEDVSFTARQGEVTALAGASGSGKTTVSRLAARFWDADRGQITVGGVDVSTVDPETLLSAFSIVFQDVTLFNDTILENIRIGRKDATDEEVLKAARLANCDEFALRLPDGYHSVIGENGSELSGGERQRVSIARAFLKDAPVILLDEASSSLDVENESSIQTAISRLIRNKTVIVIAHRMRTVLGADKVVVLSDGRVAEEGTPAELLDRGGLFAQMAAIQREGQDWSIRGSSDEI